MIARTSKKSSRVLCANPARYNRRSSLSASHRILRKALHYKRPRQPLAVKNYNSDGTLREDSPSPVPALACAPSHKLPSSLPRPKVGEVSRGPILSVYPELENVPTEYMRRKLAVHGAGMLNAVANVRTQSSTSFLPRELEIIVNDMVAFSCPTHMLAVYGHSCVAQKRKVTVFPTHDLILATHCTNLPSLPFSKPDVANNDIVKLPVVPLCLPSPETFSILQSYLYTKRTDHLLAELLPTPSTPLPKHPSKSEMVDAFSHQLATPGNMSSLARHSMIINGLWRNACALGVRDDKLWNVIEAAWEVVVGAMGKLQCQH